MSPASSGTLEVERYIGACLISHNHRTQLAAFKSLQGRDQLFSRDHYPPDIYQRSYLNADSRYQRVQQCNSVEGWAGGMPLISFANFQRKTKRADHDHRSSKIEDQHSPLARLAVHTQGAPLILTKPYSKKNKLYKNQTLKFSENISNVNRDLSKHNCQKNSSPLVIADAVSVTSDESSGSSGNSENCLPRIIKPRKRRKKDRKPLLGRSSSQEGFSTDSASPDVEPPPNVVSFIPYAPFHFSGSNQSRHVPDHLRYRSTVSLIDKLHLLGDISEIPRFDHSIDELEDLDDGKDVNGNQLSTSCQCRYCDPAGQIWDVDRSCYSPFLTSGGHPSEDILKLPEVTLDCLLTSPIKQHNCLVHCMSWLSLNDDLSQKASDTGNKSFSSTPRSSSDLEVSTEIVTSLNGHRDLEIKFFSTACTENVRSPSKDIKSGPNDCRDM